MTVTSIKKRDSVDEKKQAIIDKVGDLSEYHLASGEVLCAIYVRPEKSAGGIIMTASHLKEDLYQGKSHLVLKISEDADFFGLPVKIHDWVVVRPSDGWALDINARPDVLDIKEYVPCRHVLAKYIRAIVPHPQMVW